MAEPEPTDTNGNALRGGPQPLGVGQSRPNILSGPATILRVEGVNNIPRSMPTPRDHSGGFQESAITGEIQPSSGGGEGAEQYMP